MPRPRALPAAALVVAASLAVAILAGTRGEASSVGSVESALRYRLERLGLSVRYVRCVDSGFASGAGTVFRCNVNFGDPHVEAYCARLDGGSLVTHVERPDLRCDRVRTEEGEPLG